MLLILVTYNGNVFSGIDQKIICEVHHFTAHKSSCSVIGGNTGVCILCYQCKLMTPLLFQHNANRFNQFKGDVNNQIDENRN